MPSFDVEVAHGLGQAVAKERLAGFVDTLAEKYKGQVGHVEGNWQDHVLHFSLSTFGIKVGGTIQVLDDKAIVHGDIPFSALMFKGKISEGIQRELTKALA